MNLICYISGLLSFFKDRRVINNIEQMIQKIIEKKTVRLFQVSDDKREYNRYKSLLDGSLKSVLDNEKISQALRDNSVEAMSSQHEIVLIHDPCDIRKKYSKKLENIGDVLDLDKNVINGYSSFNTVVIENKNKRLHLVDSIVYSNKEPNFLTQKELDKYQNGELQKSNDPNQKKRVDVIRELLKEDNYINLHRITKKQLKNASEAFKKEQADAQIVHVLDCGFDDKNVFDYIDKELKDEFIARLAISRNSNDTYIDEKKKKRFVKLKDVKLAKSQSFFLEKVQFQAKTYQKANCLVEYDNFRIEDSNYTVVRITLKDRYGKNIFKKPMLLLTNRKIKTAEQAHGIYFIYLQRSKIEGVFKFIKEVLGWEEFQVRDFESIKNIIALGFFIGGYFYEIEIEDKVF